jgi:Zn-dependent M28 family amino/carboxypeptidase
MNGAKKFHPATGPAFAIGEEWLRADNGPGTVKILNTRVWGPGKWDVDVTYSQADGSKATKDAWNFQVRYFHVADQNL